jgi:hypothetical protein
MRSINHLRSLDESEHTITLGEWKRCREAEYQRVQDQKKKEQTKGKRR